ncbi:hypothetical protein [Pseudogemmobacter faecipullorum]|uniref:DUF2730 family protein n=1 Tax=Pseudogemmobacter faecipullorum TaxID=2755041 RepID=A0ABS8CQU0_9RHOB|nr:hypothetical protein [Pseudogemmobacter faecipullorum]MCB5411767.1 hypothetical protein [Pseudogemmobacter faecipullorum]
MALKYDGTINAGHFLTAGAMFVSALCAVIWIQADLRKLAADQQRIEAFFATEVAAIRSDAAGREGRLRTAELTIAGQASDLRSISATLSRIERLLETK